MATPMTQHSTPKRVVTAEQARQGETSNHVRWVLRFSLALALVAGVGLWIAFVH